MHFTRDPIIETIISPKDGFKLSVRSSRSSSTQEEYIVNALEVVSFGTALFFRSLENPKAFLLPISDYEVLEVKEARMVLKNVSLEKPIKIGDGKEMTKPQEEDNQNKDKNENKKNSKKRTSRKKRKAEQQALEKMNPQEQHQHKREDSRKEHDDSRRGHESSDEVKLALPPPPAPIIPIVFPTPPKIIGRKIPLPEVEKETLSEEFAMDPIEQAIKESHDPLHVHEGHGDGHS